MMSRSGGSMPSCTYRCFHVHVMCEGQPRRIGPFRSGGRLQTTCTPAAWQGPLRGMKATAWQVKQLFRFICTSICMHKTFNIRAVCVAVTGPTGDGGREGAGARVGGQDRRLRERQRRWRQGALGEAHRGENVRRPPRKIAPAFLTTSCVCSYKRTLSVLPTMPFARELKPPIGQEGMDSVVRHRSVPRRDRWWHRSRTRGPGTRW